MKRTIKRILRIILAFLSIFFISFSSFASTIEVNPQTVNAVEFKDFLENTQSSHISEISLSSDNSICYFSSDSFFFNVTDLFVFKPDTDIHITLTSSENINFLVQKSSTLLYRGKDWTGNTNDFTKIEVILNGDSEKQFEFFSLLEIVEVPDEPSVDISFTDKLIIIVIVENIVLIFYFLLNRSWRA